MTDRKLAPLGETPTRRKPGSFNRSKMIAALKRQARARRNGNKPEPAVRWHSARIMEYAGQAGMLGIARSRRLCGYRWRTPSKY